MVVFVLANFPEFMDYNFALQTILIELFMASPELRRRRKRNSSVSRDVAAATATTQMSRISVQTEKHLQAICTRLSYRYSSYHIRLPPAASIGSRTTRIKQPKIPRQILSEPRAILLCSCPRLVYDFLSCLPAAPRSLHILLAAVCFSLTAAATDRIGSVRFGSRIDFVCLDQPSDQWKCYRIRMLIRDKVARAMPSLLSDLLTTLSPQTSLQTWSGACS